MKTWASCSTLLSLISLICHIGIIQCCCLVDSTIYFRTSKTVPSRKKNHSVSISYSYSVVNYLYFLSEVEAVSIINLNYEETTKGVFINLFMIQGSDFLKIFSFYT